MISKKASSQIPLLTPQFKMAIQDGISVIRFTEKSASPTRQFDEGVENLIDEFREIRFFAVNLDHQDNQDDGVFSGEVDEMLRLAQVGNAMPHIAIFQNGQLIDIIVGAYVQSLRGILQRLIQP